MLSIHSPDSVFTILVSIFMWKTHNHFGAPFQCYKYVVLVLLERVTIHSSTTTRLLKNWTIH